MLNNRLFTYEYQLYFPLPCLDEDSRKALTPVYGLQTITYTLLIDREGALHGKNFVESFKHVSNTKGSQSERNVQKPLTVYLLDALDHFLPG